MEIKELRWGVYDKSTLYITGMIKEKVFIIKLPIATLGENSTYFCDIDS